VRRNCSNATVVDRVFERLTRFLEQRGRSGLARRKLHAGEIGGMVHALDQDNADRASGIPPPRAASRTKTQFSGVGGLRTHISFMCSKFQRKPPMDGHESKLNGSVFGMHDWPDSLRGQAALYRKLAEQTDDPFVKSELLELASVCEEIANNIEDHLTDA
jgi:hypothetical protein